MGLGGFDGTGAILADDMGLGKTLTTISVCWTLLKQGYVVCAVHPVGCGCLPPTTMARPFGKPMARKIIIVVPSSLVDNWRLEFKKWLGPERCRPVTVNVKGKVGCPTPTIHPTHAHVRSRSSAGVGRTSSCARLRDWLVCCAPRADHLLRGTVAVCVALPNALLIACHLCPYRCTASTLMCCVPPPSGCWCATKATG